jgi:hypothetical protein
MMSIQSIANVTGVPPPNDTFERRHSTSSRQAGDQFTGNHPKKALDKRWHLWYFVAAFVALVSRTSV